MKQKIMSSKYLKLPEATLRMKLSKLDRNFLPANVVEDIVNILDNYNQEVAASLAFEAELSILDFKKKIKAKEDEEKKIALELKIKEDAEKTAESALTEEVKRVFTTIISDSDFVAVKNAFGVFKKDENDIPLFSNINDQFHDHMKQLDEGQTGLRYLRAVSVDKPIFDENMSYRFINTNVGNAQSFEGYEKVFFICFRLFVDPVTLECKYESFWIVNTSDDLAESVIPFDYKYFEWEEICSSERYAFICEFLKLTPDVDENYKSESYFR